MHGVVAGFTTIVAVIGLGYVLAVFHVVDEVVQRSLARVAFFVASPCLLFTVTARADVAHVFSRTLAATAAGVAIASLPYIVVAALFWRRRADDIAIGAMCSAYCNAANLGLPVAAYVLGDAALVTPMLMLQLIVLQPLALAVLDAGRSSHLSLARVLRTPVTNPLTIATVLGIVVALTDWRVPDVVWSPVDLVGGIAVPGVLLAYGISLRTGPLPGRGVPVPELALVTGSKLGLQPVAAYVVGRALGLQGHDLLALAVTAALPSAQNIFVHASRFGRQVVLARDAIFVTTIGSVPAIFLITWVIT